MNSFSVFIGLRYTLTRKQSQLVAFISRISTIGMVLAVSVLITVVSVMNGFDRELRERILAIVPHATLTSFDPIENWKSLINKARNYPGVSHAAPFSYTQSLVMNQNQVRASLFYGIDPDYEKEGSILSDILGKEMLASLPGQKTVIMGHKLARHLKVHPGDTVKILVPTEDSTRLPVVDYFKVSGLMESGTELDERLLITHRNNIASLKQAPPNSVDGMRISVENLFAANRIASRLGDMTQLFYVRDWSTTHGNLYQAVTMSRNLVLLLVFIIIAVAAFNVVSTLVLAVNDKAADIAILRTMGCSNRQIIMIFVVQGVTIGLVGTVVGVALGLLFSAVISDGVVWLEQLIGYKFLKTEVYPIDHLPSDIRFVDVFIVAGLAMVLSMLATIFPAWQASKVEPAKVLRYE